MKYYGDIPSDHLELLEELQTLEIWFNEHKSTLPPLAIAKGMTCIAHDYYLMDMDEEGDRFIKNAEQYCPGYFAGPIHVHAEREEEFGILVYNLTETLGLQLMISLGFESE